MPITMHCSTNLWLVGVATALAACTVAIKESTKTDYPTAQREPPSSGSRDYRTRRPRRRRQTTLNEERSLSEKHADKLARARCPKPKYRNERLERLLVKLTGDAYPEWSELRLSLSEPYTYRSGPKERTLVEEVQGKVCLKASDVCRVQDLTFNRTKPDGGSWNSWNIHGIGPDYEILCKYLNK